MEGRGARSEQVAGGGDAERRFARLEKGPYERTLCTSVCMKIRRVIEYFRKFKRYRLHPARETICPWLVFDLSRTRAAVTADILTDRRLPVASFVEESNERH